MKGLFRGMLLPPQPGGSGDRSVTGATTSLPEWGRLRTNPLRTLCPPALPWCSQSAPSSSHGAWMGAGLVGKLRHGRGRVAGWHGICSMSPPALWTGTDMQPHPPLILRLREGKGL